MIQNKETARKILNAIDLHEGSWNETFTGSYHGISLSEAFEKIFLDDPMCEIYYFATKSYWNDVIDICNRIVKENS